MAKKTITSAEFLQAVVENNLDVAGAQQMLNNMRADGLEVLGGDEVINTAKQIEARTPPTQPEGPSTAETVGVGAVAAGIPAGLIGGKMLLKNIIGPSEKEIGDAVNRTRKYLVGAGGGMKPEAVDETTKDIVKMLGNTEKYSPGTKFGARSLYNYAQSIKDMAFQEKEQVKAAAGDRVITTKALDPLREEITKLERAKADKSKIDALKKKLADLEEGFDKDGKMSVAEAEDIKKYHAAEFKGYKAGGKIGASPESNTAGLVNKKVAEGFRNEIQSVVPEVKVPNAVYGAAKDVEAGLGKYANVVGTQPVATPFRVAQTKAGNVIKEIPGISAAGKGLTVLPEAAFEERMIPKYIKMFSKYGDKVMDYIDKEAIKGRFNVPNLAKGLKSLGSNEGFLPPGALEQRVPKPASFPIGKQEFDTKTFPNIGEEMIKSIAGSAKKLTPQQEAELKKKKQISIQTPGAGNVAQIPAAPAMPSKVNQSTNLGGPKFGIKTGF